MALKTRIQAAKEKASLDEATKALREERSRIIDLEVVLNQNHELDLILSKNNGAWSVLLPTQASSDSNFEREITRKIGKALKTYNPKAREYHEHAAFDLKKPISPGSFDINVRGVNFTLRVIRENIPLENGRTRSMGDYIPRIRKGEEFTVTVSSPTCNKYNLISLYSGNERDNFPGYKVPFRIVLGDLNITTHVSSAPAGTKVGELAGTYIASNVRQLYDAKPSLRKADKLRFKVVKPGKVYEIVGQK